MSYDGTEMYDKNDEIVEWARNGRPIKARRTYYYSKDGSCQDQIEDERMQWTLWSPLCVSSFGENFALSVEDSLVFGD